MLPKYGQRKPAKPNSKRFVYWDVEKGQFRSFLRTNFIGIDGVEKEKNANKADSEKDNAGEDEK